jgi:hypothetical protein
MKVFFGGCLLVALAAAMACEPRSVSPSKLAVPRPQAASATAPQHRAAHATPEAPGAPAPPRATVERRLVSERECQAEVFAVEARTFVACRNELLVLEAGQLRSEPALAAGLELNVNALGGRQLVSIAGRWPDALWAATGEVSGGGNSGKLSFFRFRKDRWAKVGASVELGGALGQVIFPWTDDGLGAIAPRPFEPTRFLAFSAKPVAAPRLAKAVQSPAERAQYRCESRMIYPERWARLGPGDVMVFSGQLCGVPEKAEHTRWLGVERLRAGHATSEVTLLPVPDEAPATTHWEVVASAALSPARVLVAANGIETEPPPSTRARRFTLLARWDGASWRTEGSPLESFTGLWALADRFAATDERGALWLEHEAQWAAVDWLTDELSSDAWTRGKISQLIAADGAWWLVHQTELRPGVTSSRLYRLELPSNVSPKARSASAQLL